MTQRLPVLSLDEMIRQASAGDSAAVQGIRTHLQEHPDLAAQAGDLARCAENQLIEQICQGDSEATECLRANICQLRAELALPTDSPIMRLVTDRVVMGWLECHHLDLMSSRLESNAGALSAALIRSKDAAQRRYLAAIKLHAAFRAKVEG